MIAAIIQARMTSTRLPGKIMLKTCNKTFLHHMIDRVKHSKTLDKIVIATTINKTDDVIETFCRENDIFCYRGSEEDLLDRYKMAADAVSADLAISLNYHTHPDEDSYCVSILSEKIDLLTLTENKQSFIELAHIRGIGKSEEDCIPLMTYFGKKLKEIYIFNKLPDVYLNGSLHLTDN